MRIKDLPLKLRRLAEKRVDTSFRHHNHFLVTNQLCDAFSWYHAPEPEGFWAAVSDGNFEKAYELQPHLREDVEDTYPVTLDKHGEIELESFKATLKQDQDTLGEMGEPSQYLDIETKNTGVDMYYVISTKRWAFDSVEELKNTLNSLINALSNR